MSPCTLDATSCSIFNRLATNVVDPALLLLTGAAALVFFYGIVEFLLSLRKGEDPKKGRDHMIWGTVGLFVMVASWGIITLIQNTVASLFH